MQKYYSVTGVFALVFSVALNFWQIGQINVLRYREETKQRQYQEEINSGRFQEKILHAENRILKDQLSEYQYNASTTRTYEEGLAHGLIRSSVSGYTDGYHAAMSQLEDTKKYFDEQERIKTADKVRIAVKEKQKTDAASNAAVPATTPASPSDSSKTAKKN